MKPITIHEIEFASSVLFAGDKTKFYDNIEAKTGERIDVIQNLENIHVNACPGSGKTTALIAKLIILANRMPFDDGRGICVLTHTNVAIDLIKEKLGAGASKLFTHPNFFGTIQSFVDRFLAIPFCAFDKKARIKYIDIDRYFSESKRYYSCLNFGPKGGTPTLKNTLYREGTRRDNWQSTTTNDKHNNAVKLLSKLVFEHEEEKLILGINGSTFRKKNSTSERAKKDFQEILDFKNNLIQEGVISFDDAYSMAFEYLKRFPVIKNAFEERFKFIFIDEMQDTAKHQVEIINTLFKTGDDSIVQYYGDPNQAIFESEGQNDGEWNPKPDKFTTLTLRKSKRFGETIASVINPLRIISDPDKSIEGENSASNIKPYLFLFDKGQNIEKVLEKFGEIIIENKLNQNKDSKFVAIGRVGKEHKKNELSIKSYFPIYEKTRSNRKEFYPFFILYCNNQLDKKTTVKSISDQLIKGILHALDLHDFRNEVTRKRDSKVIKRRYTKTTLLNFLRFNNEKLYFEFKEKLIEWTNQIYCDNLPFSIDVKKQIEKYLEEKLLPIKALKLDSKLDFFQVPNFAQKEIEEAQSSDLKKPTSDPNVFMYKYLDGNTHKEFPIKLNTIHGEKGETHTATLVLETYYRKKHDSEQIKQQLLGELFDIEKEGGKEKNMAIKMSYVAMSRPKQLLCFAIQKCNIQDILDNPENKDKLEKIWSVIEI